MIILIRNMHIRFFGGDKYSKNISDNTNKIKSQDFGGDKYSKNISDNTNKIKSQDFGENTYSKNIIIIYVINDKF